MPRINPVNPEHAQGKAKQLLDGVQKSLGTVPNIMATFANSPAALEAYVGFLNALEGTSIDAQTREAIAIATSGVNGCDYCTAAHTALGKMRGLSDEEAHENLNGRSSDTTRAAALGFARAIVDKKGWVDDRDLQRLRAAGLGDTEATEILAVVAATIFSNYFNHIAQNEVDFPAVGKADRAAA